MAYTPNFNAPWAHLQNQPGVLEKAHAFTASGLNNSSMALQNQQRQQSIETANEEQLMKEQGRKSVEFTSDVVQFKGAPSAERQSGLATLRQKYVQAGDRDAVSAIEKLIAMPDQQFDQQIMGMSSKVQSMYGVDVLGNHQKTVNTEAMQNNAYNGIPFDKLPSHIQESVLISQASPEVVEIWRRRVMGSANTPEQTIALQKALDEIDRNNQVINAQTEGTDQNLEAKRLEAQQAGHNLNERQFQEQQNENKLKEQWKKAELAATKAAAEKEEKAELDAKRVMLSTQNTKARLAVRKIDNILPKLSSGNTGWMQQITGWVPWTEGGKLGKNIDALKAQIGFDELNQMRAMSKTGGALGQVSEREIDFLQSAIANIDPAQTADQLRENLLEIKYRYEKVMMLQNMDKHYNPDAEEWGDSPEEKRRLEVLLADQYGYNNMLRNDALTMTVKMVNDTPLEFFDSADEGILELMAKEQPDAFARFLERVNSEIE